MQDNMYRDIKYSKEAKQAIKAGVDKAADAIKVTLGVTGKTVIIQNPYGSPIITDDGVTVAQSIKLKDPYENLGAQLITEVANKTDDTAGDGTTTATVLAQRMLQEAFGDGTLVNETNETELKDEMRQAVDTVIKELHKLKKDCTAEDIEKVATVSSLDPAVGKLIAEILSEVGNDGIVTVEETQKVGITKEVVNGMRFEKGYISPYMINNSRSEMELVGMEGSLLPSVFITDKKLVSNADILPIMECCASFGQKQLLLICEELDGEALASCVMNKIRGGWNIVAVKIPGFAHDKDEYLKNIAVMTGATVYTEALKHNLKNVKAEDLGRARRIIVSKDHTTIIDGQGKLEEIKQTAESLKLRLLDPDLDQYEKARVKKHIANLVGGIGVIKVGAFTETEMKAKKYKIEDALNAAKAAIAEGIIIGGGSALAKVGWKLIQEKGKDNLNQGEKIVYRSSLSPLDQMAENRGLNALDIATEVVKSDTNIGYNFRTGKLENLMESGIVDPFKVTRLALENAYSIASTIITLEAVIVEVKEEKENKQDA